MKKLILIIAFSVSITVLYSQADSSYLVYMYFQKVDTVRFSCEISQNLKDTTLLLRFSLKRPRSDSVNNFAFTFEIDTIHCDKSDSRFWHMWDYDVFLISSIYSFHKESIKKTIKKYPTFFATDYFGELRRYKIIKVVTFYDSKGCD